MNIITGKVIITNSTVAVLQDVIENHPISTESNNFIEVFEAKNAKLHRFAKALRQHTAAFGEMLREMKLVSEKFRKKFCWSKNISDATYLEKSAQTSLPQTCQRLS